MAGPGASSGRGFGLRRSRRALSEINVVPYIDVTLVLLIIFMVTAPMIVTG
ncbi:MAG: biopolymer transporter ExbD, partial [Burkholderiaceae bacterium]